MKIDCNDVHALFGILLDGELEGDQQKSVREHLKKCSDCKELLETIEEISDAGSILAVIEPPENLAEDLADSPCRLWLGLLFQAVDREISQHNLERLLSHLEACPSCRRTWQDLTLIHQIGDAMQPSDYLLKRCISAREPRVALRPILSRRMATAAAYFLAVLTTLIIGNPAIAIKPASAAMERMAEVVGSEVEGVAADGRGEVRVMLWRAWTWGQQKAETVREYVSKISGNDEDDNASDLEQGEIP